MGGEKRIWITFLEVDGVEELNNQVCGINLNRIWASYKTDRWSPERKREG